MWRIVQTEDFARQARWYGKKKGKEFAAVASNLNQFLEWLNSGHPVRPFAFGFLHDEPAGVIAIDQRGASTKLAATRLYLYAYVERETVYLLTIGDKRSQNQDVQDCKRTAEAIQADPSFGTGEENQDEEDRAGR